MPDPDYDALLNLHLSEAYKRHVIGHEPAPTAMKRLGDTLVADTDLKAAAVKRLASLTGPVCERDFVSRVYRDLLTAALARGGQ